MDSHENALSPAQWSVMECLWEAGSMTGREATVAMEEKMGWSRSTTLTLLRRMEEKGFVTTAAENGIKIFLPALHREDAALRETESLLERVYHGSISMLVSAMTHKHTLSQQEIDRLHALLDEMEGAENDPMDR